jgi:hypothetical protein
VKYHACTETDTQINAAIEQLQVPAIIDGVLDCTVRIGSKLNQFFAKNFNEPPWTCRVCTRLIRITLMLELKMEAEPVHLFKDIIRVGVLLDW